MLGQTKTPLDDASRENQRAQSTTRTKPQSSYNNSNRVSSIGSNNNISKLIHLATHRVNQQSKVATKRSESPPLSSPHNFILDPAPHNPLCDASFGYFDRVVDPYFSSAHPESPLESGLSPIVSAVKSSKAISTAAELDQLQLPLSSKSSKFDMLSPSTVSQSDRVQKQVKLDMPLEGNNEHLDKNWTWNAEKSVHQILRAPNERLPQLDDETSADEGNVWKRAQEASDSNFKEGLQSVERGKKESQSRDVGKGKQPSEDDNVFKEFLRDDIDYDDTLNTHPIVEEEGDVAILK